MEDHGDEFDWKKNYCRYITVERAHGGGAFSGKIQVK
jgi:hypothetical protein